ncbi:MAG: extracellular solute-binding protein [Eubacteriales bacterium]|nr:extracellular solute-binding protein [Eubacteriales bacterium]
MSRKATVFLSAFLALTFLLTACSASGGGAATTSEAAKTEASTSAAASTAPTESGRRTLSLMFAEPTTVEDVNTNYATQYLSDKMDVDLTFNFLPSTEWQTKLEIMVSANEKLSDVLFGNLGASAVAKYGASGVFLDLLPYYNESSVYIRERFEEDPNIQKLCTFADGSMYAVARVQQQSHTDFGYKFFLNQQWLDNLNLEMPTTIDGLTDVLTAFRDDDPNGNNMQDELPMTGSSVSYAYDPTVFMMGSFTFFNVRHLLQVEDGKINPAYVTDGWREGLRYCKMLYDEGLLDPMLFTQDLTQYKALLQKEGDTIVGSCMLMNTSTFDGNPKMLEYTGVSPFKGPDGTQYAPYQTYSITYNGFITRDASDPAFAFQFLDYLWELDASMVIRYGEENVDWEWVPEGTPCLFESSGYPATFRVISNTQTGVQNKWWNVWSPMFLDYSIGNGWADDGDPMNIFRIAYDTVGKLQGYIPDEVAGMIVYTVDENTQIAEISSNITSYWKECKTLFIIGDMDLDSDWDSYLAELDKLGLQEYLEVTQNAYTRTYSD